MDVKEFLRFADDLVLAKTGKHLNNVQRAVLLGSWQDKKYPEIAEEYQFTKGYVANVASKLWQLMSNKLSKNINKSNLIHTMETYHNCNVSNLNDVVNFGNNDNNDVVNFGNINKVCTETSQPPNTPQNSPPPQTSNEDNTQQKPRLDLRDAPELRTFYDRPSFPLTTLENAIARQNCRLLTITGMAGTGKSAIARNLIPQIQTQFDRII
ncbi:hypothetical protein QT972_03635 [Microcoleus sp. herbarium7]|uniref:hypothetical protein n=1 Tax=Microcoleus sp. herbarium7 TaxID=3055435 RepID=UPI002FD37AEF